MGGGIATIVAPNLEIAKTHKTEFSITVIKRQNKFFVVINFYCPPTTS